MLPSISSAQSDFESLCTDSSAIFRLHSNPSICMTTSFSSNHLYAKKAAISVAPAHQYHLYGFCCSKILVILSRFFCLSVEIQEGSLGGRTASQFWSIILPTFFAAIFLFVSIFLSIRALTAPAGVEAGGPSSMI